MNPRHRISTRAIIRTPKDQFLLFLSHFEPGSNLEPRWVFPGGGLEPGEAPLAGIMREVLEETGRVFDPEGFSDPLKTIWHPMEDPRFFDSGEAIFFELLVPEVFEPENTFWTAEEHRDTVMHRWWSLSEVLSEQPWIGPDGAIEFLLERLG